MKTNQVMIRPMGRFEVLQRTKDGMFNATALLQQWNSANCERKEITKFFDNANTKLFIEALIKEEKLNTQNSAYLKSRGKNGGTWMHPILFIKFAMWLNPKFEVQVIKFVYDELIKNRHLAGDNYNVLTSAIATLPDSDYKQVATAIQWIVFNRTGKNLRQQATQDQLREISEIEHSLAFSINMGMIKNNQQLIELLRKMWYKKYQKF